MAHRDVVVFDGATMNALSSFFAYDSTFRNGVSVAGGEINGQNFADIVTGAGPGGAPNVRGFTSTGQSLFSFFAGSTTDTSGVRVAVKDLKGTGIDSILTGSGQGGGTLRVFDATTQTQTESSTPFGSTFTGGIFVG